MREWKDIKDVKEQPLLQLLGTRGLVILGAVWLATGWVPTAQLSEALLHLVFPLGMLIALLSLAVLIGAQHPAKARVAGWVVAAAGLGIVGVVAHSVIPLGYLRSLVGATTSTLIIASGLLVTRCPVTVDGVTALWGAMTSTGSGGHVLEADEPREAT